MSTTLPIAVPMELPTGFTARPATMEDADAAARVTRAAEVAAGVQSLTTVEDVRGDWARPSMDLRTDTIVVEHEGEVVAYAEQFHGRAFVHVLPDRCGLGVGTALAAWAEAHARSRGLARVGQTLAAGATSAQALLTTRGHRVLWESWILRMDLDSPPGSRATPPGVSVRDLRRPDDDRDVYDTIEAAFGTWPDRDPPSAFEDWRVSFLDRADTALVVLAEESGRVVGVAVCSEEERIGWVDQLAVHPDHWGRGIGGALLSAAFRRFHDVGLRQAALNTDSRTGALGLYEHAGMRVTETFLRFALDLH